MKAEVLDREKTSKMTVLRKATQEDSVQKFEGMWLQCCDEVITNSLATFTSMFFLQLYEI